MTESQANPFKYRETDDDRRAAQVHSTPMPGWPEWVASALLAMMAMAQLLIALLSLASMDGRILALSVPLLISAALPYAAAKRISVGRWPWFPAVYVSAWCGLFSLTGAPNGPAIAAGSIAVSYSLLLRHRRIKRLDFWL